MLHVAEPFCWQISPLNLGMLQAGALEYPAGRIPELLRSYLKLTATAPEEMMLVAMVVPSQQGPRFRILFRYCGEPGLGNQLLRPFREPSKAQDDTVKLMSYLESQATGFPKPPKPLPYFVTSLFLPELNEAAIAAITTRPRMRHIDSG